MWLILSCPWGPALLSMNCGWYLWFWTPSWLPLLKSVTPSLVPVIHGCFAQPWPLLLHWYFQCFCIFYWKCENVMVPKISHADYITYWRYHLKPTPGKSLQPYLIYLPETRQTPPELLGPFRHPTCSSHYHCPNSPIYPITWENEEEEWGQMEKKRRRDREHDNRK